MKKIFNIISYLIGFVAFTQTHSVLWKPVQKSFTKEGKEVLCLQFDNASAIDSALKVGYFDIKYSGEVKSVSFSNLSYIACTDEEKAILNPNNFSSKVKYTISKGIAKNQIQSFVSVLPIVKGTNGQLYKISNFTISTQISALKAKTVSKIATNSSNLSSGSISKISVANTGVYKLDYSFLQNIGFGVSNIDPSTIQVFGFGGMLPERNIETKYYDVPEIPLQFFGNNDATFDPNEYFLVYLQGPNKIEQNNNVDIIRNVYSEKAFYFVKHSINTGKRIQSKTEAPIYDAEINQYDFVYRHENENTSLLNSGREWVGESLVSNPNLAFNIPLPDLIADTDVTIRYKIQGANTIATNCNITIQGATETKTLLAKNIGNFDLVQDITARKDISSNNVTNKTLNINFNYSSSSSSLKTHLDFFQINALAQLKFNNSNFLTFRSLEASNFYTSKFNVSSNNSNLNVWDVSQIDKISELPVTSFNGGFSFIDTTIIPKEYVIVNSSGVFSNPTFESTVVNQDLHSINVPDLLIVTPISLKSAADSLANFRRNHDGYDVQVVVLDKIYNEFSSGAQDISAIRNFAKYLYSKDSNKFKYLLLFGACSFDYKDRIAHNTNLVPVFETPNTSNQILSYSTDDYYGLLDDLEGGDFTNAYLDISIGRLPVRNLIEANEIVAKLINYSVSKNNYGKWRNDLSFVCDDGDGNLHMDTSEDVISDVSVTNNKLKINKFYINLYPEEATPIGQQSTQLTKKLLDKLHNGTFVLNYSGHGREIGWASENVLTIDHFSNLNNFDKLFLLVTATCEFGRYDDPEIFSGIQAAILNPKGGAVATLGATRPVYASSNRVFNKALMNYIYQKTNGKYNTIGELMMKSKNSAKPSSANLNVNYGLLGDPSMVLAYPNNEVVITNVTNENNIPKDTIKALSKTKIVGEIQKSGNVLTNFNGDVYITLFDKEFNKLSKYDPESDGNSSPALIQKNIKLRESIIYQGKASVTNGLFSIEFIVPKDISYVVGNGLILSYAINQDSTDDASGGDYNYLIGDSDDNTPYESNAPVVQLFMNDTTFFNGGQTYKDVVFIAKVYDDNGINLSQSSVGHEITMILDGNTKNTYILNDYYFSDKNSFTNGKVIFPIENLSEGIHTITFKIWDIFNNSTTQSISFEVVKNDITIGILDNIQSPNDDFTEFLFTHNRAGEDLVATLQIFDLQGRVIKELNSEIDRANETVTGIHWQTKINNGSYNISEGLYVYRLLLKSKFDGSSTNKSEKLVFIK